MKRIVYFLCAVLLLAFLAGCGSTDTINSQTPQQSEPIVSQTPQQSDPQQTVENKELSDEALAKIVAKNLDVPEKAGIEYSVSEAFYWEAAEQYFKNVNFTENGETVACAGVDPCTGELLRNIFKYED